MKKPPLTKKRSKPNWRFVFGNGNMSSWYAIDSAADWEQLPPSIRNGYFAAVIVEEEMTKEEFKRKYPDIQL